MLGGDAALAITPENLVHSLVRKSAFGHFPLTDSPLPRLFGKISTVAYTSGMNKSVSF